MHLPGTIYLDLRLVRHPHETAEEWGVLLLNLNNLNFIKVFENEQWPCMSTNKLAVWILKSIRENFDKLEDQFRSHKLNTSIFQEPSTLTYQLVGDHKRCCLKIIFKV